MTERANLALPVPFSRAEMRDLVERARVAIDAYYVASDRDNDFSGALTQEHAQGAMVASHTLALIACFAGATLDTSFVGGFSVWPDWDTFGRDRRSPAVDYFSDLSALLALVSDDEVGVAANHEEPAVREALALALTPENAFHRSILDELVKDSQYRVSVAAREKLSAPWYAGVFERDPKEQVDESLHPLFEKLETAFTEKWYRTDAREAGLEEVLPRLPDAVALPLLAYHIQEAETQPREALVQDLLRRPDSGMFLVRALCNRFDHEARGSVDDKAVHWLQATGADSETVDVLLRHVTSDGPSGFRKNRHRQLPKVIAGCWKPTWNPAPLLETWVWMIANPTEWSAPYHLLYEIAKAEDVSNLRDPVLDWVGANGVEENIDKVLQLVFDGMPPDDQKALLREAEQSPIDSFAVWALQQQERALTRAGDATRCRAQMGAWLNDARKRTLIEETFELVLCALPELRPALGRAELTLERAETIVRAVGALYGGVTGWPIMSEEEAREHQERRRQGIEPWLDPEGGQLSEAEWDAYRGIRDAHSSDGAWRLGPLPRGPWDARDRKFVERLFGELTPDMHDFQTNLMCLYEAFASKHDESFLPHLTQLQRWRVDEDLNPYCFRGLDALVEEWGGTPSEKTAEGVTRFDTEEEWMDTDEDET